MEDKNSNINNIEKVAKYCASQYTSFINIKSLFEMEGN